MKQRVITAAILVIFVVLLFVLPMNISKVIMAVAAGILAALAYKETLNLKDSHKPYPKIMTILGFICMELITLNSLNASYIYNGASFAAIGATILLLMIPGIFDKKGKYTTKEAFYLLGTTMVIGFFFNLLMLLFFGNKWLLLYLILIATMTDTFAMLIGCLIGKHKLIPDVSPKKSVEGSIAGSAVGTIIASIYYYNIITSNINIFALILMTLFLSILGQLGDLFFSKIKRENGIKDFSNIMPGHGGILDRFDSLTFILYGYIVIINIINILK